MHKKAKKLNSDATPVHPGKIRVNQLFQRFLLILLFLSNFPSNSEAQLSSFYSLVSSLDNKNNETSSASAKIKRSSNLFWESGTKSPITSYWTGGSLELERSRSGNNASTLPSSPAISLSEEKVENLTFFQSLLRSIAATRVREELAEISSHWANTARYVVSSKYSEVIHLTRKAHAAQLESLQKSSMAQLLNDAVSKASRVYHSSRARLKILETAQHAAMHSVELIAEALSLVQQIFLVRDKWAREERARAFRLSTEYLKKVLEDLNATLEFAQIAHSVVDEMK